MSWLRSGKKFLLNFSITFRRKGTEPPPTEKRRRRVLREKRRGSMGWSIAKGPRLHVDVRVELIPQNRE